MANTVDGLVARGHDVTVVAPAYKGDRAVPRFNELIHMHLVPVRRRSLMGAFVTSLASSQPLTIRRHSQPAVRREVGRLIAERTFDVVHVEQLQALAQAQPTLARGMPVVLRAQNVESELWSMLATTRRTWRPFATSEAGRLARWEAAATARVTITVAITQRDAGRLERLAPGGSLIRVVRAPMPRELGSSGVLPGRPSIVLLSNRAWLPNRDGVGWFLRDIWPAVRRALPDAQLHLFGPSRTSEGGSGVHVHPAPADSREAFSQNSVLAVPLRMASGVRVKILEAWARGMPVVATPVAALGLDIPDGRGVRLANTAQEFVEAFKDLGTSRALVQRLVAEGRAILDEWHQPQRLAEELERVYAAARVRSPGR
jgi:hypothetical protein